MDPAPSNSLRHALAIVAVASAGVIHEYLPAPPPQNSLLDWVHTGGEAAPFLRFAGRFSSPESLALSTTRWPEQNVQIQESIVSDLPHETQCNAYLSAPQLFSHVWHDIKSFATLCQKDLGDRRRRDWPASIEEQLGGPLNRALKVLDTDSDVSRVVIWPKFPDPEQPERNTRALVRQSFRGGVLGSGAAAPALRAAQRDGDYLHWHSVAAGSLIAMLATQSLTLGALAVIPGLLSVAAAHRLFASLGGPSTLATLVAHAVTYAVLLIASVRVVRACAAALEEERSPKVRITLWRVCAWIGASATLAASLLLSDVPAVQQFAGTLALGLALGIPLVAAILPALARPTPALVAPHPLRKGLPRWLELAGLGVFMASVGILGARIAYDATAGFNTGFTSLPIVRDYWPAVEYYWPTVQYYWASVQWLVTPLPVLGLWLGAPLAMGAGLRGARHVRAVFAEWFPASAGLGKLPVVLPWQVLGVLSLLFIVAAPPSAPLAGAQPAARLPHLARCADGACKRSGSVRGRHRHGGARSERGSPPARGAFRACPRFAARAARSD